MMVDHVWTMVDHGRPWSGGQMFAGVVSYFHSVSIISLGTFYNLLMFLCIIFLLTIALIGLAILYGALLYCFCKTQLLL